MSSADFSAGDAAAPALLSAADFSAPALTSAVFAAAASGPCAAKVKLKPPASDVAAAAPISFSDDLLAGDANGKLKPPVAAVVVETADDADDEDGVVAVVCFSTTLAVVAACSSAAASLGSVAVVGFGGSFAIESDDELFVCSALIGTALPAAPKLLESDVAAAAGSAATAAAEVPPTAADAAAAAAGDCAMMISGFGGGAADGATNTPSILSTLCC